MDDSVRNSNQKLYHELHMKNIEARDKAILTLCSASLAFSLSVYEKVYTGVYPCLLILVWALFAISVLSTLYSFISAEKLADNLITLESKNGKGEDVNNLHKTIHFWNKLSHWLSRVSVGGFTVGLVLFVVFSSVNLMGKDMSDRRIIENGYTPPTTALPPEQPAPPTPPQEPTSSEKKS